MGFPFKCLLGSGKTTREKECSPFVEIGMHQVSILRTSAVLNIEQCAACQIAGDELCDRVLPSPLFLGNQELPSSLLSVAI